MRGSNDFHIMGPVNRHQEGNTLATKNVLVSEEASGRDLEKGTEIITKNQKVLLGFLFLFVTFLAFAMSGCGPGPTPTPTPTPVPPTPTPAPPTPTPTPSEVKGLTVKGVVQDGHGHFLQDVEVLVETADGVELAFTTTDKEGRYALPFEGDSEGVTIIASLYDRKKDRMIVTDKNGYPLYLAKKYAETVDFNFKDDIEQTVKKNPNWDDEALEKMDSAAAIYYYSYQAIRFYEDVLGEKIDYVTPVFIFVFADLGTSYDPYYGGIFMSKDYNDSLWNHPERINSIPNNLEWHEFSHHLMNEIYQPIPAGPPTDIYHNGYLNSETTDSWREGFAEFFSLLIAENYGDPKPYLYRMGDGALNLEGDYKVWDPYDEDLDLFYGFPWAEEEFSVAGILWDLHDGDPYDVDDYVSLSVTDIWTVIKGGKPKDLEELYEVFKDWGQRTGKIGDADQNGVNDLDEIFIAHGAHNDTIVRNLEYDAGEEIGYTGSSGEGKGTHLDPGDLSTEIQVVIPVRPNREKKPPIPGSYLLVHLRGTEGEEIEGGSLGIEMRFAPPFDYYTYWYEVKVTSPLIYFEMPPADDYSVKAYIRATAPGYLSAPLVIDNEWYWRRVVTLKEGDYLVEHTFILERADELGDLFDWETGEPTKGPDHIDIGFAEVTQVGSDAVFTMELDGNIPYPETFIPGVSELEYFFALCPLPGFEEWPWYSPAYDGLECLPNAFVVLMYEDGDWRFDMDYSEGGEMWSITLPEDNLHVEENIITMKAPIEELGSSFRWLAGTYVDGIADIAPNEGAGAFESWFE